MKKRILSIVLMIALLLGGPGATGIVQAKNSSGVETVSSGDSGVRTENDMKVDGTDSFGNLFADAISEETEEQEANGGYNVFSVEMSEKTAMVSLETIEASTLVVGIFNEEGTKLFASGTVDLEAGIKDAVVEIDTESMPEYYYLRAYLMDTDTLEPLCTVYENRDYTAEMQEFYAMTVDDFEGRYVLNLDEDKDNNFAVFAEDTKVLTTTEEGVNQLTTADEENEVYIFENADEQITGLQEGDIFTYEYESGMLLIVKVGTVNTEITDNGTNVTITGQETSLEEVFEYVKINAGGNTKDLEVDDSELPEGIIYNGMVSVSEAELQTYATSESMDSVEELPVYEAEIEEEATWALSYKLNGGNGDDDGSGDSGESGDDSGSGDDGGSGDSGETGDDGGTGTENPNIKFDLEVSGDITLQFDFKVKVNISWDLDYYEVEISQGYKIEAALTFSGKVESTIPLAPVVFTAIPGVNITFEPAIILEIEAKVTLSASLEGSIGFRLDKDTGYTDISQKPTFKVKFPTEMEVTVFLGFSAKPAVNLISDKLLEVSLEGRVGCEAVAKIGKADEGTVDIRHDCTVCVDGDLFVKAEIIAEIKLLNKHEIKNSVGWKFKLADFHISGGEFELGECPNRSYRVSFFVQDKNGVGIPEVKVYKDCFTDEYGKATIYLKKGKYDFEVEKEDYKVTSWGRPYYVTDKPLDIVVDMEPVIDFNIPVDNAGSTVVAKHYLLYGAYAALMDDGGLYLWGNNTHGQVGNNSTETVETPVKVLNNIAEVYSPSNGVIYALAKDGSLYAWGGTDTGYKYGQSGCGTTDDVLVPTKILEDVEQFVPGYYHSAAITKYNELYVWGRNNYGQVGNGTKVDVYTPVKVMDNAEKVYLTSYSTLAIDVDGNLYCCGKDSGYNSGSGTTVYSTALSWVEMENVKEICQSGDFVQFAITKSNELYNWYRWDPEYDDPRKILDNVASAKRYEHWNGMSTYSYFACTTTGELYSWGDSRYIGLNETDVTQPTLLLENVVDYGFNGNNGMVITADGKMYLWGDNDYGQLGNGTTTESRTPVLVEGIENVKQAMVNVGDHTGGNYGTMNFAITEDNRLYLWGENAEGYGAEVTEALSAPTEIMQAEIKQFIPDETLRVLTTSGDLYMWGDIGYNDNFGEEFRVLKPTLVMKNVEDVVTEGFRTIARTKDGSLYWWLSSEIGYIENPVRINFSNAPITPRTETLETYASGATDSPKASEVSEVYAENGTLQTVTYDNLHAGVVYNFYVLKDRNAEAPMASDNLLYIGQAVSDAYGSLSMSYQAKEASDEAVRYVISAEKNDISNSKISAKDLVYNKQKQSAFINVKYDEKLLIQGIDYEVTGDVTATEIGSYSVTVTGIGRFTGSKTVAYDVACNHNYAQTITAATMSADGKITSACSICGETEETTTIPKIASVTLSETSYTYNGKVKKPAVTVKDSKGNKIAANYYKVTYSNNKKAGVATVTVKMQGNYSGTIKKTFEILPKGTSISGITAKAKGFTVKWKAQKNSTKGYEIQYSTSSKFTKKTTKTVTVSNNKTVSKSISKLAATKKYFVRVRTYQTVKSGGKTVKLYSSWSDATTVITKDKNGKLSEIKTIKLSKTKYKYNGKVQKPTVTVKDKKGNALTQGTDYTVSYSKGCKKVGTYKVTVKFKGNYKGVKSKTLTYKIVKK